MTTTQQNETTLREKRRKEDGTEAPVNHERRKEVGTIERPADAKAWFEGATRQHGSWWEHWKTWLLARSGSQKAAPATPGNTMFKPLVEAPGTYVYE